MRDLLGELTRDRLSNPVRYRMQAFDYGDGKRRWAGWVNHVEGHPHWHPIVVHDYRPFTLVTNNGLELEIMLYDTAGYFQGIQLETSRQ